jgi:hypothetical protein
MQHRSDQASTSFRSNPVPFAISCCLGVQAVHHVAPGPDAWPALARCTALAELCLVLPDPALADQFAALPASLTRLRASGVNTLQVMYKPPRIPAVAAPMLLCYSANLLWSRTSTCSCQIDLSNKREAGVWAIFWLCQGALA